LHQLRDPSQDIVQCEWHGVDHIKCQPEQTTHLQCILIHNNVVHWVCAHLNMDFSRGGIEAIMPLMSSILYRSRTWKFNHCQHYGLLLCHSNNNDKKTRLMVLIPWPSRQLVPDLLKTSVTHLLTPMSASVPFVKLLHLLQTTNVQQPPLHNPYTFHTIIFIFFITSPVRHAISTYFIDVQWLHPLFPAYFSFSHTLQQLSYKNNNFRNFAI